MDHSPLGSSVRGINQARILEWVAISFSRVIYIRNNKTQVQCLTVGFECRVSYEGQLRPGWNVRVAERVVCSAAMLGSFSSVQSLSRVQLSATLWIAARQASLSITNSWSLPKLKFIESVMPSSHLILCRPLLLLPPIPPSIRVFSNESTLCMSMEQHTGSK